MIQSNTPWSGLEAGKVDTRRVAAAARWNWFWAVLPGADATLVLQLADFPTPLPDLPRLRNLEIRFQTLLGGPIIYLRLTASEHLELFETLCRDVIEAGETAETEAEALERAIRRMFRWHYLLRGGQREALSEEAQKGLIGELEVLKLAIHALGVRPALTGWAGPSGSPKDFEFKSDCIEVKARRGASQPFVKISNEYQLSDVSARRLWLAVLAVDKVATPHGRTLTDFVAEVTRLIELSLPSAITDWDVHLADAGFDSLHDYSDWRWIASAPNFYAVIDGFPRLTAPMPLGVSSVTYSLALAACAPFQRYWIEVQQRLTEEDNS